MERGSQRLTWRRRRVVLKCLSITVVLSLHCTRHCYHTAYGL